MSWYWLQVWWFLLYGTFILFIFFPSSSLYTLIPYPTTRLLLLLLLQLVRSGKTRQRTEAASVAAPSEGSEMLSSKAASSDFWDSMLTWWRKRGDRR